MVTWPENVESNSIIPHSYFCPASSLISIFCLAFPLFPLFFFFFAFSASSRLSPRFGACWKRWFGRRELFPLNVAHLGFKWKRARQTTRSPICQMSDFGGVCACRCVFVCLCLAVVEISAVKRSSFFYCTEAVRRKFRQALHQKLWTACVRVCCQKQHCSVFSSPLRAPVNLIFLPVSINPLVILCLCSILDLPMLHCVSHPNSLKVGSLMLLKKKKVFWRENKCHLLSTSPLPTAIMRSWFEGLKS